jgi:cytochrome P450
MFFDFTDPEVVADPYPHYARYRSWTRCTARPRRTDLRGQWFLFRHADVLAALRDPRLGRDWHRVAPWRPAAAATRALPRWWR